MTQPGDPLFEQRYRAIAGRDTRFDGQFVTAVTSTGIYCRPSCPARTPKPGNVRFYLTSAAAHEAGFRACKRCLPEATPGTPEWDLRRDVTGRAMRLIADGVVDREGVAGLSTRLGYTPRHTQRLLVAQLGAGPLALARARRAQTARALLVGSDLPLAQVAYAAGFGSIRQFNDTIREVFDASPRELRDQRRMVTDAGTQADPSAATGALVRLSIDLPVRQPFDAPGVFSFFASRAVAGVESAEVPEGGPLRYARTLNLPHGPGAVEVVATRLSASGAWQVRAKLELTAVADVATAVTRVRRLFDLDADPAAVDSTFAADPELRPLVARTPGMRVPGAVDPHEMVVRALVGQQISVAAARTHLSRLTAVAGARHAFGFAGLDRLFPTPADIVATVPDPGRDDPLAEDRPLRLPRRSVRAVVGVARALDAGEVSVDVGADPTELTTRLLELPGIGPWSAAYITMRVLGDPDAWPQGDVALVAGAHAVGMLDPAVPRASAHRVLTERARAWSPWRSYAAAHLWQAALAHASNQPPRKVS